MTRRLLLLAVILVTAGPADASTTKPAVVEGAPAERDAVRPAAPSQAIDAEAESEAESDLGDRAQTPAEPAPLSLPRPKYTDLWARLRDGFGLPGKQQARSRAAARQYSRARRSLREVGERAKPFLWNITGEVEKRGMPTEIALLPVVESGFRPFAYSHGKASGLWQFLPATGRRFGLDQNWWYDGRRDVLAATEAALDYLQFLHRRFDGDWLLALAAYNCGEGTIARAIRRNRAQGKSTDFWSLKLPRETRDYVPRLLGLSRLVADPAAYKLRLPSIPNRPQVYPVELPGQVDLALIARLANLEIADVYRLNPGYNHWATRPEGPHRILLPAGRRIRFEARLAALPEDAHVRWKQHTVGRGDTLAKLAHRHDTTSAVLRQINGLDSARLRPGQQLLIPVSTADKSAYTLSQNNRRINARKRRQANRDRAAAGNAAAGTYVVRSGDTLSTIAHRHGVGYQRLADWNQIPLDATLALGQRLVVRDPSQATGDRAGERQRVSYQVRRGDSLWRISRKFKVAVNDLKAWNAIGNQPLLQPGQQLTVYVDSQDI